MRTRFSLLAAIVAGVVTVHAQPTAFTYQGRLADAGGAASGAYDLRFELYDSVSGGTAVSGVITNASTVVSNGLFTVTLDFSSAPFTGAERWLEIGVRTNGAAPFITLAPRQRITATPYALMAGNVSGVISNSGIAGGYSNAVTFTNPGNSFAGSFAGNGAALSNVNAQTLGGFGAHQFWRTTGNAGTTATNFIGTTDAQPLEVRVGGGRALRLEPNTNGAPNVIAGARMNEVAPGIVGATIAGGGAENYFGSATTNRVSADFGSIGGGAANVVEAASSMIGGGFNNVVRSNAFNTVIGGGSGNLVQQGGGGSVVAGGYNNRIQPDVFAGAIGGGIGNTNAAFAAVVAGGFQNSIETNAAQSVIAGGYVNRIGSNSYASSISGGEGNAILGFGAWGTIAGGRFNVIELNNYSPAIAGGEGNVIRENVSFGFIGGGNVNSIEPGSGYSVVGGGYLNTIQNSSGFSIIGGGESNGIAAAHSVIGGGQQNRIEPFAGSSVIGGGWLNHVFNADQSFIGGGNANQISDGARESFVGGGFQNMIQTNAPFSMIAAGTGNRIGINSPWGAIAGGQDNVVPTNSPYATIPGGVNNAAGAFSFAAGRRAKALHTGSFVWADSTNADFATTGSNQFLIRASGGVGINTTNPTAALEVAGTVKAGGFADNGSGFTGSFIGNGGSLSNVNAASLGGVAPSNYWRLGGNTASSFPLSLGTVQPFPMTIIANNRAALRLEPASRSVFPGNWIAHNLVGGSDANSVSNGVLGATIAGGGYVNVLAGFPFPSANRVSDDFGTIGGGLNNAAGNTNSDAVDARAAVVAGGENNHAGSSHSTIAGGLDNTIGLGAANAFIGGGAMNLIDQNSMFGAIGGGNNNRIEVSAVAATVAGGQGNVIADNSVASTIAGGGPNSIARDSMASAIGGGSGNEIDIDTDFATIGGGEFNRVSDQAHHSSVVGGYGNLVEFSVAYGTIGGGRENHLAGGASHMTIGGGINNFAAGAAATVPGGDRNVAGGEASFAAGRRAQANHAGSFVWADAQDLDFRSTAANQFSIRASGGVRLSPDTPGITLANPSASITFAPPGAGSPPMIHLFESGTGNSPRMVLAHSPAFSHWGLQYDDNPDRFHFVANGLPVMTVDLGSQRVGIGQSAPSAPLDVNGEARATVFTPTSDRDAKHDFKPVDPKEVLARVTSLPITRWTFKSIPGAEHIGPVAQDFHAAFGLGSDDRHIATVDADGIALAAIQGLNRKVEAENQALRDELRARAAEMKELRQSIEELRRMLLGE
jgi:hypothetical protein